MNQKATQLVVARARCFIVHRSAFFIFLGLLPAAVRGDGPAEPPDPVPIKRVWLTPDQAPREMERAKQGLMVKLPRDEFEELVRRAAQAEAARKNPPRLVGAFYHAELADGALVGYCQWKVVHTAAGPGLLPLTPLNLALRQPRFENRPAYIGDFDGHDPSLLVEQPGDYSALVDWSARAEARPDGLQFDLKFPASPAGVLELDLPADKAPLDVDGGGLSGPGRADAPNLRRWTIACGGRSQVSLRIRSLDQAPVLRAGLETTQVLSPAGVDATYAFALKALHQGVRELVFECDSALRPYGVDAPGLDRWEVVAAGPDDPTVLLIVRLAAPLEEGNVGVRCLAPLGDAARAANPVAWRSPGMRLLQCVNGGETLVLKVHPDLRLADVGAGAFRLKETGAETDPDGRTEYQRLTFLGGGLSEGGAAVGTAGPRPRAAVRPHTVEFRARQLAWWRLVDPAHPTLALQTAYDVSYGRLFQLAVRLPADWEVDRVDLAPAGLLRNWGVRTEGGVRTLVVDLQRALAPEEKPGARGPTLTVALEPARAGDVLGKELPFPDAEPLGARFREGALAIGFDEQTHRLEVRTAAKDAPPEDEGPWGKEIPAYYYPYREQSGEGRRPAAGTATLRARPPQVRAQVTSDVALSAGQASVDTRLLLEAEQGSPESVDLYLSAPAVLAASGDPWNWRAEQGGVEVRGARRLHAPEAAGGLAALGAGDTLGCAALQIARPRGECWRVTFGRPLRVHEPVLLHATLAPKAGEGRLEVPLTAVLGASRLEGEATLHLAAANPPPVEAFGLREASPAAAARPRGGSAWRTFRYNGPAVGLALVGPLPAGDRPAEASVDWAALTTYVGPGGVLEHHYVFQASHWSQNTLPLQMPAGARLVALQVDGVWSPRPPAAEEAQGRPVIDLPAPARAGEQEAPAPHRYEVVYATAAAPGWLWTRIEAPAPSPPVPPAAFQRRWRLAPDFSPLGDGRLVRRPGPGEGTPSAAPTLRPEDLFRAAPGAPAWPWQWPVGWDETRGPDGLPDVLRGLRGKAEQPRPIGAVLGDAAAGLRKARRQFLVVDAAALRDAGVGPDREVTFRPQSAEDEAPPWDSLGLAAASVRGGCLLTTRRQLAAWGETGGAAPVPPAVEAAAAEAARWGRDASGRFQAAPVWAGSLAEEKSPLPSPEMALAPWTEWEPAPGRGDADAVVIVRRPLYDAAGWALVVPLGLLFLWAGWCWRRARLVLLLLWLAAAGLGVLWLPAAFQGLAWPALLAGCACALAWRLWSAARRPAPAGPAPAAPAKSPSSPSALAAAGSAALLLLAVACRGRPADVPGPAATTVFLVPGSDDATDKTSVLAPPELLDQLRTLARPGAGPAAVPVSAEYAGEVVGGVAEFDAAFDVLCFTDGPTTVALTLDGVQLCLPPRNPDAGEVRVGGIPVKATALPAPQAGVVVPIKGGAAQPGGPPRVERVDLHFRTPVTGTEEERDVQFTAPRLAQSRLTLKLPPASAYAQASAKHGVQKTEKDAPNTLDVELGPVAAPLHVRWTPEAWLALWPEAQVREAYLWDLGVDSSTLTALLSYNIGPGGTGSLAVRLPEELEALAVEARRPRDGTPVRLRDWKVAGAGSARTLTLDFASLVGGDVDVTLTLAPRAPWPASFVLPLPSPVLPPGPAGGKPGRPRASYLAYRTHGLNVDRVNPVGVTGIPVEQFAPLWPAATRPDPHSLAYASTILREDEGRPPVLGLKVRPSAPAADARVDLEVRVGPAQADVRATAVLAAREGGLSLVQWRVRSTQPFTVTGVAGPNVRRWSQEGDRVLAWLEPAAKGEAKLELTGWLPLAPPPTPPPPAGAGQGGGRLELPNLRLSSASQETSVRLIPGDQVSLTEAGRTGLTPLEPKAGGVLAYTAGGREDYAGAWQVHTGPAQVRVCTVAGMSGRRLSFVAVVDCQPSNGRVEALTVRVRNWAGEVRLTAPDAVRQRERRRGPDEWAWAVEQDPGKPGRLRLVLTGEQPAEAWAGGVMPDVTVPGAARVDRWAAVAGAGLTAEPGPGLAPAEGQAAPPADLKDAPEPARLGPAAPVWKITSPEWRLNLAPHAASSSPAPIEVYLAEYRAAPADGGRWMHEAAYWLRHEANTDLNLTLPADAEVLSVAIDDDEAAPLQAEPRRLWLPLTGRPAVCRVRVRWRYTSEEWARPNLGRPTLQGATDGPSMWTVFAPPGWAPDARGGRQGLESGLAQAAALSWQRAEAMYDVSAALARQAAEGAGAVPLAEAQRRFYAECRRAREALEASGGESAPAWPGGRSPAEALQELMQRNKTLAADRHFEAVRAEAENAVQAAGAGRADDAPAWESEGRPLYARAAPGEPAPTLTLAPEAGRAPGAWAASAAWLGLLLAIGLLSLSPSAAAWSRALWPEQIGLVGLIVWWAVGTLTLVVALLLLLAVVGRLWTAAFAVGRLFQRPPRKSKSTASAPASPEPSGS